MDWSGRVTFCDDIRQEANGKLILIGVYLGELIAYSAPAEFVLATLVEVRGLTKGHHDFKITVQLKTEDGTTDTGDISSGWDIVSEELPASLAPTGLRFIVERDCVLIVSMEMDGEPPREVDHLKISIRKPPEQVSATS